MSSSDDALSRRAVIAAPLILASCGFTPAFGPQGPATPLLGMVSVQAPATPLGFFIRRQLIDRLGGEGSSLGLAVDLDVRDEATAIAPDGASTRISLIGSARWTLSATDGTVLGAGVVEAFTAYSATGSTIATATARSDAEERLAIILADRIMARLIALGPPAR